jgi:3-hydroxyacyl-CoA dehydrogenase
MNSPVSTAVRDGVAVVTLDNPPVNAFSAAVRAGVKSEVEQAIADPAVQAVVLICAGRTFVAGADISEFGKPAQDPSFFDVFDLIEFSAKPVIAAIHGTALGGGFELALVCHYRVATKSAKVGLPEVHLGLLPGAGGTQRLPRLVGAETALEIMTSGRQVRASEALSLGLLDKVVVDEDLLGSAVAFAQEVIAAGADCPRVRDRTDHIAADGAQSSIFEDFRRTNARRFRGYKAPEGIVKAVEAAMTLPFDEGMQREQALFQELVESTESAAQRHLFFAERGTAQVPDVPAKTQTLAIDSVGVIGAGTMGGGIAMNFLNAGIPVTMVEMSQAALDRGIGVIRRNYEGSAAKGRMTTEQVEARMALITPALRMEELAQVDLVIEAVFESMDVKKQVFSQLDAITKPGAILASNTSFLDLNEIAAATRRPESVIGLHFFSPANVMRLLEVVRGEHTSPDVIATAMRLAKRIAKVPVLSRVCPGFIANRLLAPRGYQAEALALEGTPVAQIDHVLTDYGFAMGHFQMMDLVGLDVVGRDTETRTVMGDLVAADRLGQKKNGGYYDYDERRRATPSPVAAQIIADVAAATGVAQNPVTDPQLLLERLLLPVVNEGARILEENIALRAADIDVAAVLGYGWPIYTGGPMFWANTLGIAQVVAGLQRLADEHGEEFRPAPLLVAMAADGKVF